MSDEENDAYYESQLDPQDLSELNDPNNSNSQKSKHKRRSKNDQNKRDFNCGCGKRYLSYPALYTHIKTKHNGKNPTGTVAPQYNSGRGRGRPRKVWGYTERNRI